MLGKGVCTYMISPTTSGAPYVTAQNRGRKRPCGRERLDVVGIDLRERRIARVGVIACRLRPVFVGADRASTVCDRDVSLRCGDRQGDRP